jgi:Flp pilus assembly pilin Flp
MRWQSRCYCEAGSTLRMTGAGIKSQRFVGIAQGFGCRAMSILFSDLIRLWEDEEGQDLIEYALLASMIAAVGVAVFPVIGDKLGSAFSTWGNDVYRAWEPENPLPPDPAP